MDSRKKDLTDYLKLLREESVKKRQINRHKRLIFGNNIHNFEPFDIKSKSIVDLDNYKLHDASQIIFLNKIIFIEQSQFNFKIIIAENKQLPNGVLNVTPNNQEFTGFLENLRCKSRKNNKQNENSVFYKTTEFLLNGEASQ